MYRLVSNEYINMINSNMGVLTARLIIGDVIVESDSIYSVACEKTSCSEKLSVGNFIMPKLTFSISKEVDLSPVTIGLKASFYVGMSVDGTNFEYALVCSAEVASITQKGQLYEVETQSRFSSKLDRVYNSALTFPVTSHAVLAEISDSFGAEISLEGVADFTIESEPAGYSCREVIASIAEKSGVNAFVSRDDVSIIFKWFEDTATVTSSDCCNEPSLSVEAVCYKGITCISGSEFLTLGEEPFLTINNVCGFIREQEDLMPILNAVSSVSYHPGNISLILGNTLYDPWDIVSITVDDKLVKLPICSLSHKYDGGLTTEIRIPEKEKTAGDGSALGKTTAERAVERLTADLVNTKLVMADKASVKSLEADVANISTILAGNVGIGNLQTISLTANNAMVSDLFVKNTIAQHLAVADLQAGDINTSKFRVVSESGSFLISDNTLRISDDLSTVRVQLGKDALGDYSLYVWDKDGKLMFDALGLHEDGIKSGIIRNDMVSDDAAIAGSKLDIESVVTSINGADTSISASHVRLDTLGQSLDVSFAQLNTAVNDEKEKTLALQTSVGIMQGQITSKVWQEDIIEAVDTLEIGGRNLLASTNDWYTRTSEDTAGMQKEYSVAIEHDELQTLINKSLTASIWIYSMGERDTSVTTNTALQHRFGCHGRVVWSDSTGTLNTTTTEYPFTSLLSQSVDGKRIHTLYTLIPPKGYDTIDGMYMVIQMYAKPAQEGVTWRIGQPKLEVGNKVTEWSPAPEDNDLEGFEVGGVNLFVKSATSTGYFLQDTGAITNDNSWNCTDYIDVSNISHYIASGFTNLGASPATCFYDADKNYISGVRSRIQGKQGSDRECLAIPVGASFMRFSYLKADINTLKIEKGTKPTSYSPAPEDMASVVQMNSAIEQSASKIMLSVSAITGILDTRLTAAQSSITQNAANIALKVSETDYTGEKIASLINQSASTVTIQAAHIELEGVVTANEGFKILTDGSMEATAGTIGGFTITQNSIRNADNTFAIVPATDASRVIGVGGTPLERNLGIFSDGSLRIGPDSSNRLVLNAGNIDFYYGNAHNGRLGQPFGNAPGFEGCDLYLSTNNKYLYGMTSEGSPQRILGITAAGNMVLSSPTNTAKLYAYSSEEMYFYLGTARIMALDINGLRFSNGTGVELNNKIALRYYASAVYCGADTEPLKLVGSSVTSNGASVTSDARMKNHIKTLDDKYISLLRVLEPKQFMYTNHNVGTTNIGFIAQEVLEAINSVGLSARDFGAFVDVYGDGREYALDYNQFIPILWTVVQKLINERT